MPRRTLLTVASLSAVFLCALIGARSQGTTRVTLRLTDAATGQSVTGIVRITPAGEKSLKLGGLFDRLRGLNNVDHGWFVVPSDGAAIELPRGKLAIEAFSGLETNLARRDVDFSDRVPETVDVPLTFLFRPAELG